MKLMVKCPNCERQLAWEDGNEFRPFCSERCRLLDLGEWVSGGRYIPVEPEETQDQEQSEG